MTNLTKWNPIEDMLNAWPANIFNRDLFNRRRDGTADLTWSPRCDVTQVDCTMVVHAELPGVDQKDIDVSLDGGMLTVRGEKRSEKKEEEKGRTYSERFYGSFERSISMPEGVDESKIEATLKDGVLEVRVPVPVEAKSNPKKIAIRAGS